MKDRLLILGLFTVLTISFGCGEEDNPNLNLLTSECPADELKSFRVPAHQQWSCITIDGEKEFAYGDIFSITSTPDCFTIESKVDNWCLIAPIGPTMFTVTHGRYTDIQSIPHPDEDGCRMNDTIIVDELICELTSAIN